MQIHAKGPREMCFSEYHSQRPVGTKNLVGHDALFNHKRNGSSAQHIKHEDRQRPKDKAPVTPGAFLLSRCFVVRHSSSGDLMLVALLPTFLVLLPFLSVPIGAP